MGIELDDVPGPFRRDRDSSIPEGGSSGTSSRDIDLSRERSSERIVLVGL